MTGTTTETKPERFSLDEDKARHWLAHAIALDNGEAARGDGERFAFSLSEDYDPRDTEDGGTTGNLVSEAQHTAHVLTGPHDLDYDFDYSMYGDHGYTWCMRAGRLNLRSLFEELRHCGEPGLTGAEAAIAVLREAVAGGNALADDLAGYVAAQPRGPVFVLEWEHKHGTDFNAYATYERALAAKAGIAHADWDAVAELTGIADPSGLSDEEAAYQYFSNRDEEYACIHDLEVEN